MPQFRFGYYDFTFSGTFSGNPPSEIRGPDRQSYVIEHEIPSAEGGIVEYLGSRQKQYSIKGFVSPSQDGPFNGTAALVLSGTSYIALNAEDAKDALNALRGSGANLLLIESTLSKQSGFQQFYENSFFMVDKVAVDYEAGHSYPLYPFTMGLRGASPTIHGYTTNTATYAGLGFSGYIVCTFLNSGYAKGEVANTLGFFANSAASGNARMAYYYANDTLGAQSAPQSVHSGWNYFPLRPSLSGATSGEVARVALLSDAFSSSGWSLGESDTAQGIIAFNSVISGQPYANGFPASISGLHISKSGFALDFVVVTA